MKLNLENILDWMDTSLNKLLTIIPPPKTINIHGGFTYRYMEMTAQQAIPQKLARITSGLRASQNLLEHGYFQEQAALSRMVDEYQEDVFFLSFGVIDNNFTDSHKKYLDAFYQEETSSKDKKENWNKGRNLLPRKKIRAFIANRSHEMAGIDATTQNPSDQIALSTLLSNAYSGFVHAASPQIMEMYDPQNNSFHTNGMLGSYLEADHTHDIRNYFIRGVLAYGISALALGNESIFHEARVIDKQINN